MASCMNSCPVKEAYIKSEELTHVWQVVWTYAESKTRTSMASCANSCRVKGARICAELYGFMPSKGSVHQWLVVPIHVK